MITNSITARDISELRPPSKYQALLFDWDGTVANTQRANFDVLQAALAEHDLPLEWSWFAERTGTSAAELVSQIATTHKTPVDPEAISTDRDERFLQRLGEIELVDYMADVVEEARASGLIVALASGGSAKTIVPVLNNSRLGETFDVVVTRDDVTHGKPAPDIFLEAASQSGVEPGNCLVYEDSDEGLSAARAAGMDSIDVRVVRASQLGY